VGPPGHDRGAIPRLGTRSCPTGACDAGWQVRTTPKASNDDEPAAAPFGAGLVARRGDGLLGLAALFDIRLGFRDEEWTFAIVEQAWSGVGMDELRVLAPGAWARLIRVLIANRGQAGFRQGPPK
jgi:hypothetical protein